MRQVFHLWNIYCTFALPEDEKPMLQHDMENVKLYTLDEVKDKHIGKIGTPQREKYETELQSFLRTII